MTDTQEQTKEQTELNARYAALQKQGNKLVRLTEKLAAQVEELGKQESAQAKRITALQSSNATFNYNLERLQKQVDRHYDEGRAMRGIQEHDRDSRWKFIRERVRLLEIATTWLKTRAS